jgi:hypothetical protein
VQVREFLGQLLEAIEQKLLLGLAGRWHRDSDRFFIIW